MLTKEYRILMPLSVEEYRIAQLYMVAKFSRERSSKGEGIEIVKNEPYEDEKGKGQYTHKLIHLGSHLPGWLRSILPVGVTTVEEKAWNAYPYVKNIYTCPLFGERFSIVSETRYYDDDGTQENVHNLNAEQLAQRTVDFIDIVEENVDPRYYKPEEDPNLFLSKKCGRGKLQKDWQKNTKPLMCIYKIAHVEFRVWGLQTKVESWIQKSMVRDTVLLGHKQAFCWIDEWLNLTIEEIRKFEAETKVLLDKLLKGETTTPTTLVTTPANTSNNNNNNNNNNNDDDDESESNSNSNATVVSTSPVVSQSL